MPKAKKGSIYCRRVTLCLQILIMLCIMSRICRLNLKVSMLMRFMKNLLEQLTITPQRREVLLHTQYISMSELIIVNEVLDNFVKFYKNRKFDQIDMDLIKEIYNGK